MDWLNIHHTVLSSEEYIDSDPTARATWLNLMGYCAVHENGGRVVGARLWKDRKCQQLLRVTRGEFDDDSMLWTWEGDDAIVTFYPVDKEELVKARRASGQRGGSRSSKQKKEAAQAREQAKHKQPPQAKHKQSTSKSTTEEEGNRNRKGIGTNHTTASGDADGGKANEFYLTRKKRKLTGKRLESFNRFWKAFNYPKGKAEAADAWLDIPELTYPLVDHICQAAEHEATARPKLIAAGKTPKYAQGWISGKRWEDEAPAPVKPPPSGSHIPAAPSNFEELRVKLLAYYEANGMSAGAVKNATEAKCFEDLNYSVKKHLLEMENHKV